MLTVKLPINRSFLSLKMLAENMVVNRIKRAVSLKRARQCAQIRHHAHA